MEELAAARAAVEAGATVVQLRRKGASTAALVEAGSGFAELGATFVVNDDVEAALELGADGVHLGREDAGADRAVAAGLLLGISAASVEEARAGESLGAAYIGATAVLPDERAGMLRIRRRFVDLTTFAVCAAGMFALVAAIPNHH